MQIYIKKIEHELINVSTNIDDTVCFEPGNTIISYIIVVGRVVMDGEIEVQGINSFSDALELVKKYIKKDNGN